MLSRQDELYSEELNRDIADTEEKMEALRHSIKQIGTDDEEASGIIWSSKKDIEEIFECFRGSDVERFANLIDHDCDDTIYNARRMSEEIHDDLCAERKLLDNRCEDLQYELRILKSKG